MSTDQVTLDCRPDGIAVVRLCDAAGKNALDEALVEALLAQLDRAARWPEGKVVLLGGLPEVFSSGAPRSMLEALVERQIEPADLLLPRALLDVPLPVVAAMEGHAVGGGLALGLCADIVLIARESRYGCSFMNLGFTPGMGITGLLEHVLSPALAHELMYTGEALKGSHFEGRGAFNYVLPRAEVWPKAMDLAQQIAAKARPALLLLKRTLSLPKRQAYEASRTLESLMHEVTFAQPDIAARIGAGYVE